MDTGKRHFTTFKGVTTSFLMSQTGAAASPLSLEDTDYLHNEVSAMIAGFITHAGRETWVWGSQLDTCRERRDRNRKKKLVHLRALWRKLPPNGLEGGKHFHSSLLCNTFLICVRPVRHTGGNIGGGVMFLRVQLYWKQLEDLLFLNHGWFERRV